MPIFDIHGDPITDLTKNNSNDANIVNIEFGAGKNYFGKAQYPQCYLTDKKKPDLSHFSELFDYDKDSDCHYLDFMCDFYEYDFGGHTFETLILCNPHGYGYSSDVSGQFFFNRAGSILRDNGQIVVLSSHTNKFGNKKHLEAFLNCDDPIFFSKYIFILEDFEELTPEHEIRQNYQFKHSNLTTVATPSQKMIIRKVGLRDNE